MRALLFGVHIRAPDVWNLPYHPNTIRYYSKEFSGLRRPSQRCGWPNLAKRRQGSKTEELKGASGAEIRRGGSIVYGRAIQGLKGGWLWILYQMYKASVKVPLPTSAKIRGPTTDYRSQILHLPRYRPPEKGPQIFRNSPIVVPTSTLNLTYMNPKRL